MSLRELDLILPTIFGVSLNKKGKEMPELLQDCTLDLWVCVLARGPLYHYIP